MAESGVEIKTDPLKDESLRICQEAHQAGDDLALLDAFMWCEMYGWSLPNWVRSATAEKLENYFEEERMSLDQAFFGKRTGRHANPKLERREQSDAQWYRDLEELVRRKGEKGDAVYDEVGRLKTRLKLKAGGIWELNPDVTAGGGYVFETVKAKCKAAKHRKLQPSYRVDLLECTLKFGLFSKK